jgi:Family of unknown function (DUF6962)
MRLAQPMTTATDYVLALLATGLGWLLWRRPGAGTSSRRIWAGAFGCLALAAAAGGTSHGFEAAFSQAAATVVWRLTMVAVGATGAWLLLAGLATRLGGRGLRRWAWALALEVALYAVWVALGHEDFRYAVVQYGGAMLATLILYLTPAVWRRPGSRAVVAGILVSFLAAGIQQARIAPHPAFDQNDLYHVVQMAGLVLLYRGAAAPAGNLRGDDA